MAWDLAPGDEIVRKELHNRYGGSRQGGIAPSRQSPNVLIFSDPDVGELHGYVDRWAGGEFHYIGEGQKGNQAMKGGNKAILNHKADGKSLRVFWGSSGTIQYAGSSNSRSRIQHI